jgi:hypothetical protein
MCTYNRALKHAVDMTNKATGWKPRDNHVGLEIGQLLGWTFLRNSLITLGQGGRYLDEESQGR